MIERLKNPRFILAVAGLLYQILRMCDIVVDLDMYQLAVDIITFAFIGVGVYTTDFSKRK